MFTESTVCTARGCQACGWRTWQQQTLSYSIIQRGINYWKNHLPHGPALILEQRTQHIISNISSMMVRIIVVQYGCINDHASSNLYCSHIPSAHLRTTTVIDIVHTTALCTTCNGNLIAIAGNFQLGYISDEKTCDSWFAELTNQLGKWFANRPFWLANCDANPVKICPA